MIGRLFCYQLIAFIASVGVAGLHPAAAQDSFVQPIDKIVLSIVPEMRAPTSKLTSDVASILPQPVGALFQWEAPNDVYKNLLFEDPLLERHGFSNHERIQPGISGLKFYTQSALFPLNVLRRKQKCPCNPLGWGSPRM